MARGTSTARGNTDSRSSAGARRLIAGLAVLALPALGQDVYRWTDSSGETHYTDDRSTIPSDQRARAQKVDASITVIEGDRAPPPERLPAKLEVGEEARPTQQSKKDEEAAVETTWRSRFKAARARIEKHQKAITDLQDTIDHPADHGVAATAYVRGVLMPNPELQLVRERLEQEKDALARARSDFDALEKHARQEAVPFEWRR